MSKISNTSNHPSHLLANIYSIPPECNFLQVLVEALLNGDLIKGFYPRDNPLLLSSATIFVPNRRAARALSAAFVSAVEDDALLLPAIKTLGDVGDEDFGISADASHFGQPAEAIKPLERTLLLAYLVQRWVDAMEEETRRIFEDEDIIIPSSRADAILLAQDLAILLGQITQEEIEWSAVQNIVPDNHAEWWRLTTTFLNIIMKVWPDYLRDHKLLDPAERAAKLLDLRTEFYLAERNKGPVIIAGSTGSVASTKRLLKAVANLKDGAIVLPGLDQMLSDAEWQKLVNTKDMESATLETHPQFGLAQLLVSLGINRDNVEELGATTDRGNDCQRLLSLALTPADFTADWVTKNAAFNAQKTEEALDKVSLIEAGNERQEALAIAIAMRESLIKPDKTAALVTPNRNLARRVSVELQRFNINVDDTGGTPLKNSQAALFLRQITTVCLTPFNNSALAALLKNPLCLTGMKSTHALEQARHFELVGMRGVINRPVLGEFCSFIQNHKTHLSEAKHVPLAVKNISQEQWEALIAYSTKLDGIFTPLMELAGSSDEIELQTFFLSLAQTAECLSEDENGSSQILTGEGSRELKHLFEELLSISQNIYPVKAYDFPSVFDAILKSITVRSRGNTHPRLHIYGPLEVRLLNHDRVILAGLNEGSWPQTTRNDAFLNRLMRQELGMASPERRTGLAAHDFQQLMGKGEVILSRSSRVDKAPTIASRWIQRLTALIGKTQSAKIRERGNQYLKLADYLDNRGKKNTRAKQPNPRPPVASRPTSLAVTDIETWIRDPYALYAKRILKLQPLNALEREADHLLKGTIYHAIMQDYVEGIDPLKPADQRLLYLKALADKHIAEQNLSVDIGQIWQLRFYEIANEYIKWEETHYRNKKARQVFCEIDGSIKLVNDSFRLRARADRIDLLEDGSLHIIDYKTGIGPSVKQAQTLSPQLALEGFIARQGEFTSIDIAQINDLTYVRLRRGSQFKNQSISSKDYTIDDIINNAETELIKLIKGYQFREQGYLSRRAPFKDGDISGDYDHLSRTREWSFGEDGEDA